MSYQGPITQKTFNRPADRYPDDSDGSFGPRKFVGLYYGKIWLVHHNLNSTNLVTDIFIESSILGSSWVYARQIDNMTLQIMWTHETRGKVCIYAVHPRDEVGRVFEQELASDIWHFQHDFGTTDVVLDVWANDVKVDPKLIEVTDWDITLNFETPVSGKVCMLLCDPTQNPDISVRWERVVGKPTGFPPEPHEHTRDTVISSQDSDSLGGISHEHWVQKADAGKIVAPLEESEPGKYTIPYENFPLMTPIFTLDSVKEYSAKRLRINDLITPLYLSVDKPQEMSTINMHPVIRYIKLSGNFFPGSKPVDKVEADEFFTFYLTAGRGVRFDNVTHTSMEITAPAMYPFILEGPSYFERFEQIELLDPRIGSAGTQLIQLYESYPDGGRSVLPMHTPWEVGGVKVVTFSGKIVLENAMSRAVTDLRVLVFGELI